MNVRSVIIQNTPQFSTHTSFSRVSLPCPPWERPDPPKSKEVPTRRILTVENLEEHINAALRGGVTRTSEMIGNRRTRVIEDKTREILNNMLETGRVTRVRDRDGYIWRLKND